MQQNIYGPFNGRPPLHDGTERDKAKAWAQEKVVKKHAWHNKPDASPDADPNAIEPPTTARPIRRRSLHQGVAHLHSLNPTRFADDWPVSPKSKNFVSLYCVFCGVGPISLVTLEQHHLRHHGISSLMKLHQEDELHVIGGVVQEFRERTLRDVTVWGCPIMHRDTHKPCGETLVRQLYADPVASIWHQYRMNLYSHMSHSPPYNSADQIGSDWKTPLGQADPGHFGHMEPWQILVHLDTMGEFENWFRKIRNYVHSPLGPDAQGFCSEWNAFREKRLKSPNHINHMYWMMHRPQRRQSDPHIRPPQASGSSLCCLFCQQPIPQLELLNHLARVHGLAQDTSLSNTEEQCICPCRVKASDNSGVTVACRKPLGVSPPYGDGWAHFQEYRGALLDHAYHSTGPRRHTDLTQEPWRGLIYIGTFARFEHWVSLFKQYIIDIGTGNIVPGSPEYLNVYHEPWQKFKLEARAGEEKHKAQKALRNTSTS